MRQLRVGQTCLCFSRRNDVAPAPANAEAAILRTLLYADIFDYPLTLAEIHHYLMEAPATFESVRVALDASPWLAARVTRVNGYFALAGRAEIGDLRDERQRRSAALWPGARPGRRVGLPGPLLGWRCPVPQLRPLPDRPRARQARSVRGARPRPDGP